MCSDFSCKLFVSYVNVKGWLGAFEMHGLGVYGRIIRLGTLEQITTKLERDAYGDPCAGSYWVMRFVQSPVR